MKNFMGLKLCLLRKKVSSRAGIGVRQIKSDNQSKVGLKWLYYMGKVEEPTVKIIHAGNGWEKYIPDIKATVDGCIENLVI